MRMRRMWDGDVVRALREYELMVRHEDGEDLLVVEDTKDDDRKDKEDKVQEESETSSESTVGHFRLLQGRISHACLLTFTISD